jgi:hypothetical protein
VALESMLKLRRRGLEYAIDRPGSFTTTDLAEDVDHPTSTTRRALEDLTAHSLLTRSSRAKGKRSVAGDGLGSRALAGNRSPKVIHLRSRPRCGSPRRALLSNSASATFGVRPVSACMSAV